jgi:hypothetical protein
MIGDVNAGLPRFETISVKQLDIQAAHRSCDPREQAPDRVIEVRVFPSQRTDEQTEQTRKKEPKIDDQGLNREYEPVHTTSIAWTKT